MQSRALMAGWHIGQAMRSFKTEFLKYLHYWFKQGADSKAPHTNMGSPVRLVALSGRLPATRLLGSFVALWQLLITRGKTVNPPADVVATSPLTWGRFSFRDRLTDKGFHEIRFMCRTFGI